MSGILLTPYRDWAKEKLGYDFDNIDLLVTALTHRSYLNEHKKSKLKDKPFTEGSKRCTFKLDV